MHTLTEHKVPMSHFLHFNTDLMDQIIEVEVDNAVRRLEMEGRVVNNTLSHAWNRAIREMINHMLEEEGGVHTIMPHDFQTMLQQMLQNLTDDAFPPEKECGAFILSAEHPTFLKRMHRFFLRIVQKKMPS